MSGMPKVRVMLEGLTIDVPVDPRQASLPANMVIPVLLSAIMEIGRLQHRLAILEGKPVTPLADTVFLGMKG